MVTVSSDQTKWNWTANGTCFLMLSLDLHAMLQFLPKAVRQIDISHEAWMASLTFLTDNLGTPEAFSGLSVDFVTYLPTPAVALETGQRQTFSFPGYLQSEGDIPISAEALQQWPGRPTPRISSWSTLHSKAVKSVSTAAFREGPYHLLLGAYWTMIRRVWYYTDLWD